MSDCSLLNLLFDIINSALFEKLASQHSTSNIPTLQRTYNTYIKEKVTEEEDSENTSEEC